MKRVLGILLALSITLTGCSNKETVNDKVESSIKEPTISKFIELDDKDLHVYLEDHIYEDLIINLDDQDYIVEDVNIKYASKEYLEEVQYNEQATSYFGYILGQLNDRFDGNKYVFTLSDHDQTIVQELVEINKTTEEQIVSNVLVGTGVILTTVTLSVIAPTVGMPVAVQVILCASAKGAAVGALSSAAISGTITSIVKTIETGDPSEIMKDSLLSASDGFKWGAISGAIIGGATKGVNLKTGTQGGLTMNQVAQIQKESQYPMSIIKNFNSIEQYTICRNIGLQSLKVNSKNALVRSINLNYVDDLTGKTNLELIKSGKAPIDPTGKKYQLHHLGQKQDSPLVILTQAEHMESGNNLIWHTLKEGFENPSSLAGWAKEKADFWKRFAEVGGNLQ